MNKPFRYNYHKAKKQNLSRIEEQVKNYYNHYGYEAPKYLHFIKDHLEQGYGVKLYLGGKRGVSKYVFVENDTHLIKVRFSNHKPIKDYEEKEDCDFYVGISHKQVSTTAQILEKLTNNLQCSKNL